MMVNSSNESLLKFSFLPQEKLTNDLSRLNHAIITIPSFLVEKIYKQALITQKNEISPFGFQKDSVPLAYIEKNFKFNITEHIKEFLLKYFVIDFLFEELRKNKIIIAGEPRLNKINIDPNLNAEFHFEFTPTNEINLEDWKYIVFKAPKRKNYRDLDKQAISFTKEEQQNEKNYSQSTQAIKVGDWVSFDLSIVDEKKNPIFDHLKESLWLKIGDEEPDISYQEIFLNKRKGEKFYSNCPSLQAYFDEEINSNYLFFIEIKDIVPKEFFSIDLLKEHFKLKTNKSVHQKLIEVFSFRNDLSLRRVIVEDLFELLFNKFRFEVPHPAILRQEQVILNILQENPDYPVYKMQRDFNKRIELLAEKQVKETVIIDQIAYSENVQITHEDIKYYLNLSNRARTKEFIYFQHPIIKANEQDYPISNEQIKQACLREKTLNYVIKQLTKE